MYLLQDSIARALITTRVAEAEQRRLGNGLSHARRLHHKAARAAARAHRLSRLAARAERRATHVVPARTS